MGKIFNTIFCTKCSVFTSKLDLAFQVHPETTNRPIVLYVRYIAVELTHVYFTQTLP